MFEEEYQLEFFKQNGYARRLCKLCKTPFWSLGAQETCDDTPCAEYSFINNSPVKKPYELKELRSEFLKFFEARGHKIIKRYPVRARWREDVFLVNASIYDFQPLITSGKVKPPANPLVISQPCIRLTDIDLVGKTSKHLITFEMLGHHAFNTEAKKIYWKEETITYCDEFFTQALKVPRDKITYKEKPWFGGGNAGPALEVIINGLEVATLVFMSLELDLKGKIKLANELYAPMKTKVVDPGYGLERLVWLSKAEPTIYDAIYPSSVEYLASLSENGAEEYLKEPSYKKILTEYAKLSGLVDFATTPSGKAKKFLAQKLVERGYTLSLEELTKILTTLEPIYALPDLLKCIAFMLGDGIVPSNTRAGYLARLVIRKALRLLEASEIKIALPQLVLKQLEDLKDFPELKESSELITRMLELEARRYASAVDKGSGIVKRALAEGKKLGSRELVELYDTYGMHPSLVQKFAKELNFELGVPENFHALLAARHLKPEEVVEEKLAVPDLSTKILFYDEPELKEFDAKVIWSEANKVILDRSAFFPESGGQGCDKGKICTMEQEFEVIHVQKAGNALVHTIKGEGKKGAHVHCKLNWRRRSALTRHHTATHIMLGCARELLGKHVWQEGAKKTTRFARLDLAHFARIKLKELEELERRANIIIEKNLEIEKGWVERAEAEQMYGFRLYQGGVPPGDKIRVVRIGDFDVQACGGTHCASTNEVGFIKILSSERIQDGIERLEFACGSAALEAIQKRYKLLEEAAGKLKTTPEELPKAIDRFVLDWKKLRKEIEKLREYKAKAEVKKLAIKPEVVEEVKIISDVLPLARDELVVFAQELIKHEKTVALLGSDKEEARLVFARSKELDFIDCAELVKASAKLLEGSGGGKPDFAQGGGVKKENLAQALKVAKRKIKLLLRAHAG